MYERNSKTTKYVKGIRITKEHYEFINAKKSKKSAAGFLEHILNQFIKTNRNEKM